MSCGCVCVFVSYVNVVGDVRCVFFSGITVWVILACCLGSCFASFSCCSIFRFFSFTISFLSFFLCFLYLSRFCGVRLDL